MTAHRLLLVSGDRVPGDLTIRDLVWRPAPAPSSFRTTISPGLEELAGAQRPNIEFVRVAVLAFLADRTARRPGRGWTRDLDLTVPVWDPDPWTAAAGDLADLLGFLTNDRWTFEFVRAASPRAPHRRRRVPPAELYSLLSGGADSLCGALRAQGNGRVCFVSHQDWTLTTGYQDRLIEQLGALWGVEPLRVTALVGRSERQVGSGAVFPHERTSRSRSLLFLAIGLAAASTNGAPLWVPENGFASLNPPLGAERRGSLSTRTTHPWYLARLAEVLRTVGAHADIVNPFGRDTKAEMFRIVADDLGVDAASALLSSSHSCARGDLRFAGVAGATHCGVCFGCLVRRAAFHAGGVPDRTAYAIGDLTTPVGAAGGWLTSGRRRDLEAVRYAAARGVDEAAVVATPLPEDFSPADAIELARRGLAELAQLVL